MTYAIIDWMTWEFVIEPENCSVMIRRTKEEAEAYGKEHLQDGLWMLLEVPESAWPYIP